MKSVLSRILRGRGNPSDFELAYIHRGAPDDKVVIKISEIARVGKGWFLLIDGETQIPFHRILYIKDQDKKSVLWEKRQPSKT